MTLRSFAAALVVAAAAGLSACNPQSADDEVVNIYTARHYASDDAVYAAFTDRTGIAVNVISAGGDLLIERIRADGARSPADVIVTVDVGRLHRAAEAGLFAPQDWGGLGARVPGNLQDSDGRWIGFAQRARILFYSRERVDPAKLASYEDLADPRWAGRICAGSSQMVYNQSLLAAMILRHGEQRAEAWARSVAANMARSPQGGDTNQIQAVAAGECDVAISNHYYYLRLVNSQDPADRAVAEAVAPFFPDQGGDGAHVNISGAGVAAGAPHPEAARAFIEFLLSDEAQRAFAELTNEIPVVDGISYDNPALADLIGFDRDPANLSDIGDRNAAAMRVFDRAGWP